MWQNLVSALQLLLDWLYQLTGNYGVAIILLTVGVRILLLPLVHAQMASARRLQRIQPQLQQLQRELRGDPQRLNQETMQLMQEHNANPAMGCLPLLVQLPIIYALFSVLRQFHIAGSHFLWIPELTQPDPYYILPVLAGLLTFVQSWLGMAHTNLQGPGAGTQRSMLYMMPIFIGYVAARFAAGIGLYWVTQSLFGIAQQWWVNRAFPPLEQEGRGSEGGEPERGPGGGKKRKRRSLQPPKRQGQEKKRKA
ncbi:MAG: YidC/Oxa1 family membrane protein insertase [Bacillota bacterium]|nr:YidC/Oxa1 family membrane protein insertase [Bacillota bacterium]